MKIGNSRIGHFALLRLSESTCPKESQKCGETISDA